MRRWYLCCIIITIFFFACHKSEPLEPPYGDSPVIAVTDRDYTTYLLSYFSEYIEDIPIIMEEQVILLGGNIEVSKFEIAHTEEIGKAALSALGFRNAALLANHGAIICGRSVKHALKFAELVEKLAWIHYGATQMGGTHIDLV